MSRNFELLQQAEEERQRQTCEPVDSLHPEEEGVPQDNGEARLLPPAAETDHGPALLAALDPFTRRQVVNIIQRLFLARQRCKAVVFSSVERGAGCTWMAALSASALAAHVKGSVCLVDGNIHSPSVHQVFRVSNHVGFAEALAQPDPLSKFLYQTSRPNLWLMPCKSAHNGHSVLLAGQVATRIEQLTSQFDYIIIDAAPLTLYNDAITISSSTDGLVLVLRANSSRREVAKKALQDAKSENVRVLGAVLNQRTYPIPEAIYHWL